MFSHPGVLSLTRAAQYESQQSMKSVEQQWRPIAALSGQMMELARAQEWEQIPPLELERRALIEAFFQVPVRAEDASEVAQLIETLLQQDNLLVEMGNVASQQLKGQMSTFATGRKAQKAYADHG